MLLNPPNPSIDLGSLTIYWYGLLITTGIFLGYLMMLRRSDRYHIDKHHLENIFLVSVPAGIVGARLYHVILTWDYYSRDLRQIINLRAGGLAIHGALLGGIGAAYLYARYKKLDMLKLLDLAAPSIALGHSIGRWGNYFNQELYGKPTDLPWKIYIDPFYRSPEYAQYDFFHPTFLYESLLNFLSFLILLLIAKKLGEASRGRVFGVYLIFYGAIRFFTETIRVDDVPILGPLKFAQITSLVLIILGGTLIYLGKKKNGGKQTKKEKRAATRKDTDQALP